MRRDKDRRPLRARHLREQVPKEPPRGRVNGGGRLVEHEERGMVENGAAERKTLLLPAREAAREDVGAVHELHPCDHLRGARAPLLPRQTIETAVEHHVFTNGHIRIEAEPLRHVAERLPRALRMHGGIAAEHKRRAARRREETADHADGRGLPRSVRADEAVDRPARHGEIQPVYRGVAAEYAREVVRLDHGRVVRARLTFHSGAPSPHPRACRALECPRHYPPRPLRQRRGSRARSL